MTIHELGKTFRTNCERIEYWLSDVEESDRKWDVSYVRKAFPNAAFQTFNGIGHGGMAVLQPEKMKDELERLIYSVIPHNK